MTFFYGRKLDNSFSWTDGKGNNIEVFLVNIYIKHIPREFRYLPGYRVGDSRYSINIDFTKAIINGITMIDNGKSGLKDYLILLDEKEDGLYLRFVSEIEQRMTVEDEDELSKLGVSYKLPKSFHDWYMDNCEKGIRELGEMANNQYEKFLSEDGVVYAVIFEKKGKVFSGIIHAKNEAVNYSSRFEELKKQFEGKANKLHRSLNKFLKDKGEIVNNTTAYSYELKLSEIREILLSQD